ncbi:MAG TPA: DUF2236 domain-containing protein, partial [Telluria sp.]|nr:DUF2236 domain-containing protein [Telluria sp.]
VAKELGIEGRWNLVSLILFVAFMGLVRGIDTFVRLFIPQFSISRLITRIFGYQFTAKVLMDQTRPLKLPDQLLNQVGTVMQTWQHDPKAPKWMNAIEDKITGRKPPSSKK